VWNVTGGEFKAEELEVIAAEGVITPPEDLEHRQQAWILESVLGGDVLGAIRRIPVFHSADVLMRQGSSAVRPRAASRVPMQNSMISRGRYNVLSIT
jgi:hypothetical protein